MDESAYQAGWKLRLRAAHGASLNVEERAAYEAGLRQLHEWNTSRAIWQHYDRRGQW